MVKNLLAMQEPQELQVRLLGRKEEIQVRLLGRKDPLEEGMVIHSSIVAWRIP